MPRIRTIKPELAQSESLGRVSRDARLCFVLMLTQADDEGRLRANPKMLASVLFPYDDDAREFINGWLTELEREGCICRYTVDGLNFIEFPKWHDHQKINRPSASKLPGFTESSLKAHGGKGKERKGKDSESDTSSEPHHESQEPDTPPDGGYENGAARYAFEGVVIKLLGRDWKRWRRAYPDIDLRAELTALDDHYVATMTAAERKKWFPRCSQALANRQERAFAAKAKPEPEWGLYS